MQFELLFKKILRRASEEFLCRTVFVKFAMKKERAGCVEAVLAFLLSLTTKFCSDIPKSCTDR